MFNWSNTPQKKKLDVMPEGLLLAKQSAQQKVSFVSFCFFQNFGRGSPTLLQGNNSVVGGGGNPPITVSPLMASTTLGRMFKWKASKGPTSSSAPRPVKRDRPITVDLTALSEEQRLVIDSVRAGTNVFFTGSAGTGKSFTLVSLIAVLKELNADMPGTVHVTASTGVAATHIGGTTLHSFAGLGIGSESLEVLVARARDNKGTRDRWVDARVLVVDEISMVSTDFLQKLDAVGQALRKNERPFGGIQLVFSGDFLQLPPVEKGNGHMFESAVWKRAIHVTIELKRVFRQQDDLFVALLQSLRRGVVSDEMDALLRSRMVAGAQQELREGDAAHIKPTRLYSHRASVDEENTLQLNRLEGAIVKYVARDTGQNKEVAEKNFLVPTELSLKVGAQVILLKNLDPPHLVNGSRGVVLRFEKATSSTTARGDSTRAPMYGVDLEREYPVVSFVGGRTLTVTPEEWKLERGLEVIARRVQVPLMLGWALSIHKSQGMTIPRIETDISQCFDCGQVKLPCVGVGCLCDFSFHQSNFFDFFFSSLTHSGVRGSFARHVIGRSRALGI